MHLEVGILLEPRDLHQWPPVTSGQALLGAAVSPRPPSTRDQLRQLLGAGAPAEGTAQVDPLPRIEAEEPHAVGGEPASITRLTERCRRGGDDPEGGAV